MSSSPTSCRRARGEIRTLTERELPRGLSVYPSVRMVQVKPVPPRPVSDRAITRSARRRPVPPSSGAFPSNPWAETEFTEREHHHGRNMWVTRKGAIRARTGDLGVIPGSMGTRSYIVEGRGSSASYCSCSHGAGRRLSRGRARRELDLDGLREQMPARRGTTLMPKRSSTRTRGPTRTSTRSWTTSRTSSPSTTPCPRSSTTRASDDIRDLLGASATQDRSTRPERCGERWLLGSQSPHSVTSASVRSPAGTAVMSR